mmetsp:Transcript_104148/g.334043  ORF Transcript_104148/g.334043 Transcript_104148/m.334043 type:complete len:430 (-) Transcript_104148:577-1866(-)
MQQKHNRHLALEEATSPAVQEVPAPEDQPMSDRCSEVHMLCSGGCPGVVRPSSRGREQLQGPILADGTPRRALQDEGDGYFVQDLVVVWRKLGTRLINSDLGEPQLHRLPGRLLGHVGQLIRHEYGEAVVVQGPSTRREQGLRIVLRIFVETASATDCREIRGEEGECCVAPRRPTPNQSGKSVLSKTSPESARPLASTLWRRRRRAELALEALGQRRVGPGARAARPRELQEPILQPRREVAAPVAPPGSKTLLRCHLQKSAVRLFRPTGVAELVQNLLHGFERLLARLLRGGAIERPVQVPAGGLQAAPTRCGIVERTSAAQGVGERHVRAGHVEVRGWKGLLQSQRRLIGNLGFTVALQAAQGNTQVIAQFGLFGAQGQCAPYFRFRLFATILVQQLNSSGIVHFCECCGCRHAVGTKLVEPEATS